MRTAGARNRSSAAHVPKPKRPLTQRFVCPSTLVGEGADADRQMIEELIAAAVNAAVIKVQQLLKTEMASLTGGLNIPGLTDMLGKG